MQIIMSIDNIHLPHFIISDLYQKTLVDLSTPEKKQLIQSNKELSFFGGYKQHIILLVNHPDTAFLTDQQLTFLSGILSACKLTLEDIGLLNIASAHEVSYTDVINAFNPAIVIMFGVTTDAIHLPFIMPEFQKQSYNNQVYLAAPPLQLLENNKELKRKLWMALQQIFSL